MPLVDGGIVLGAGVGAAPGGVAYFIPKVSGFDGLHGTAIGTGFQGPVAIFIQHFEKLVGDADAVVAILSTYGAVCFAFVIVAVTGGYQGSYLIFFLYFPIDKIYNFGMV